MDDVAVTRVGNQNFKVMSCQQVASCEKEGAVFNDNNIQEMIEPLKEDDHDEIFIQGVESKFKDFLSDLVNQPDGIKQMDFTSIDNKEYKILCHKFKPFVFGFLLSLLSDSEMSEIERNSVGKTYLTGDMADMFKKKEDFN